MDIVAYLKEKDPHEREFHQAVSEVTESIRPVLADRPDLRHGKVLKRRTPLQYLNNSEARNLLGRRVLDRLPLVLYRTLGDSTILRLQQP